MTGRSPVVGDGVYVAAGDLDTGGEYGVAAGILGGDGGAPYGTVVYDGVFDGDEGVVGVVDLPLGLVLVEVEEISAE